MDSPARCQEVLLGPTGSSCPPPGMGGGGAVPGCWEAVTVPSAGVSGTSP